MTQRVWTDRSRIETAQECARRRWLAYHEGGIGIVAARTPLPLVVGGAVHAGIATLLRIAQQHVIYYNGDLDRMWADGAVGPAENDAVRDALAEFALRAGPGLALDANEEAGLVAPRPDVLVNELEASLGMALSTPQPSDVEGRRSAFDAYLALEQRALVEGLVRAYARRRLRPLLEEFEVLEVEREGQWLLSEWHLRQSPFSQCNTSDCTPREFPGHYASLWFMSRPDALLLGRADRQLYLLSLKTASGLDARRRRDAERDMQGLSEGIEVEQRLAFWWNALHEHRDLNAHLWEKPHETRWVEYLKDLPAPPRILAVRYEFLLKGERWADRDLAAAIGVSEARSQRSHLVRAYEAKSVPMRGAAGYSVGDLCWSWDYLRVEDMRDSKLAWQNWKSVPVWEREGGIRAWIDKLDTAAPLMSGEDETVGMEPRALGWRSDAQALGVTAQHPLDAVFPQPIVVYRGDDEWRDLIEQIESQERQVAEHVAEVHAAADEGERRSLLNRHFIQHKHSCSFPSECSYVKVCFGGEDIRRDPLASGLFRVREANHPIESQK